MITELVPAQIGVAAEILARAFQIDPLAVYAYPDAAERKESLEWLFLGHLRYGLLFGQAYTTEGPVLGAAIWLRPGDYEMDELRLSQVGLFPSREPQAVLKRLEPVFIRVELAHKQEAPTDHWYLDFLGVEPTQQGQGIGGQLLSPILATADRNQMPCFTWTAQPKNVNFYQKLGFQLCTDTIEEESHLQLWTFFRPPAH